MAAAREALGYVERPFVGWRDDVAVFLGPRLSGYSGLKVADLTAVELESRRRMLAHLEFFRAHAPGFERAWLMLSAPQLGIRHTRRLIGRHKMSRAEWMDAVVHPDEIGVSPSPSQKYANISVPYGALVARDLDNLLAAGRHVASDPATQAFMREIPQCWMTGQAAGVAAALAVEAGHDVTGVHLALSPDRQQLRSGSRGCCSVEDAHDARRVADALGIPFYVWDLAERFREDVVEDFVAEYAAGRTPNPCLRCNEKIKFSAVLDRAQALDFDASSPGTTPGWPTANCAARWTRRRTSPTC
ncbi:hypothetical protein A7K94_0200725, partial [Modestobacter sp. VKM Ac-2676]